jgi:ATPase family AAA domain-containing protein 3A/B
VIVICPFCVTASYVICSARKLAQCSNMDYAIMSGGDVGPLGEQAVDQLNELFRWASRSKRGLLLFIDEAEAFLSTRKSSTGDDDSFVRHALNVLLYQTGTQSRSLMLVLATNRPGDLDPAVLDRVDLSMFIGLPALPERTSLVKLYLQLHVMDPVLASQKSFSTRMGWTRASRVTDECISEAIIEGIADRCEGFSGREISKLFIAAYYALLLAPDLMLTGSLLKNTVEQKVVEHLAKRGFVVQSQMAASDKTGKPDGGSGLVGSSGNGEKRKTSKRIG